MKNFKSIFFLLPFLCFCLAIKGQDKVYLRSGEVVETNVIRFTQNALIAKGEKGEMSYDTDAIRYVLYKNGILDRVSKSRRINRQSLKLNAYTSYKLQLKALPNSVWIDAFNVFTGYEVGGVRNGFSTELTRWFKKGFGLRVPLFFGSDLGNEVLSDISSVGLQYVLSTNPFRRVSFEIAGGLSANIYRENKNVETPIGVIGSRTSTENTSGTTLAINLDAAISLKLFKNFQLKMGPKLYAAAYQNTDKGASVFGAFKIGLGYNIVPKKVGIQDL